MSDLTPCCRCTLESIKRIAQREGRLVKTEHHSTGEVDVFMYPPDETPGPKHRVASLMRLSDVCVC